VRDQERSLRFYRDQLGFALVSDSGRQSPSRWITQPGSEESKFVSRAGLLVFVSEDVPAKFKECSARDVRFLHPPITGLGVACLPASRIRMEIPST
jgi:phosphoserine phosphatase RsbU/P